MRIATTIVVPFVGFQSASHEASDVFPCVSPSSISEPSGIGTCTPKKYQKNLFLDPIQKVKAKDCLKTLSFFFQVRVDI